MRTATVTNHEAASIRVCLAWFLCISVFLGPAGAAAPRPPQLEDAPLMDRWLAAQSQIQTWEAEFTQTRNLKALTQPLSATGRIRFAAPNQFRWEVEQPSPTIALRLTNEMLVVYPLLKRMERFPLSAREPGPWREALALLEAGFPRSRAELESRFTLGPVQERGDIAEFSLEPKSTSARRFMPRLQIGFSTRDFSLRHTQLEFADGSSLRNQFTNGKVNPALPLGTFDPPSDPSYTVVEPAKSPRKQKR